MISNTMISKRLISKKIGSFLFLMLFSMLLSVSVCSNLNAKWEDYIWRPARHIPDSFKNEYWLEFYFLPDNPKYGFACGGDGFGNNGVFAKTSDSGKTWYSSVVQKGFHAESIYFVDTNVGYISGYDDVYKTIDGGKTWKLLNIPNTTTSIWGCYVLGKNNVWVATGNCSSALGKQSIYKSVNGGNTWNEFAASMQNTHFTDLKMYDSNGLGYAVSSGYIWQTLDGGITWKILNKTPEIRWSSNFSEYRNWHEDINMFNESILIPMSAGCSGSSGGTNVGALGFSRNLGKTWKSFITKGSMFGTFLLDDSSGWGCGYNNEVYYTTNSGASWVLMNCGIPPNTHLDDLWFINDTVGFVSGTKGIYKLEKKIKDIAITGDSFKCRNDYAELMIDDKFDGYAWFKIVNGDTIPTNMTSYLFYTLEAGTYFVRGYYSSGNNSKYCDSVQSQPFTINNYDALFEIKTNSTIYCEGDTAIVWFEKPEKLYIADSYWTIDGIIFYADTLEITTNATVKFIFVDSNNCGYTITKNIEFNKITKPILQSNDNLNFCIGETAKLKLENYYEFTDYIWFCNDTVIAQNVPELSVSKQGKYYVFVSKNNNCRNISDVLEVTVKNTTDVLDISMNENPFFIDSVNYGKSGINKIKVFNKGNEIFVINSIFIKHKLSFTVPLSQFPIAIPPKGSSEILIYYTPSDVNVLQFDTIIFVDNCSNQILPISGFGKKNFDNVTSICDVEIKAVTHSVVQKKLFTANNPVPNPAFTKTKVSYKIELLEEFDNDNILQNFGIIDIQLFDIMGNKIETNFSRNILSITDATNSVIETGELIIETAKLNDGIYFARINCENTNLIFTIIK